MARAIRRLVTATAVLCILFAGGVWLVAPASLTGNEAATKIFLEVGIFPEFLVGADCRYLQADRKVYVQVHGKPEAVEELLRHRRPDQIEFVAMPKNFGLIFRSPGWWNRAARSKEPLSYFTDGRVQVWVNQDSSKCYIFWGAG